MYIHTYIAVEQRIDESALLLLLVLFHVHF